MVLSGAYPLGHLLAGQAADRYGLPLVLVVMGLGIAAASAVVFALGAVAHFANNPRLRR